MSTGTLPVHRFYYLHNFCRALEWIKERYIDILSLEETAFIEEFDALPQASQALFVRMLMRKGPWFRASKLIYEEIPYLHSAVQPLLSLQWLSHDAAMSVQQLFDLYTKPELVNMFAQLGARSSMRKQQVYEAINAHSLADRPHPQWLQANPIDEAWCFNLDALSDRLRLMFFGNLYQDWSEFVLADLGIFKYESVAFDATSRAFQCTEDLETYERLHTWNEHLRNDECVDQALTILDEPASNNPWLERRRQKLLFRLGQVSEKQRDYATALRVYAACAYPGGRHRHIRVLEKLGEVGRALELAQQTVAAPLNADEQQKVARMLPRLLRSSGCSVKARKALNIQIAQLRIDLTLEMSEVPVNVERALQAHWHCDAAPVFYVENTLFNALFGLLFWDAIFAPVQGAFFHPFQGAPADFGAPDFVQRRALQFAQGMQSLNDGSYQTIIRDRYLEKHGTVSPFVAWAVITPQILELALHCFPPAHLKAVFERMQSDVKNLRTGFPDLVRFWPNEQRYELVEAKAPGDKLQDNQILWLECFVEQGIPVKVCHVTWQSSKAEALP